MRNDIHIVLDSIAVAEETPLRDDPRCHVVPLLVRHGDTEWVDGEKSLQEMFAMVEASGQLPKTSQPAIGRFLDVFTELAADGKKVIAIMLDGVLSGTVQTARLAARQVMSEIPGSDIRVFDSLTAACPNRRNDGRAGGVSEGPDRADGNVFFRQYFRLSAERRPHRRRRRFSR